MDNTLTIESGANLGFLMRIGKDLNNNNYLVLLFNAICQVCSV